MLNKKQIRVLVANTKNIQQSELLFCSKIELKNCILFVFSRLPTADVQSS
jgi:hypothetical protein